MRPVALGASVLALLLPLLLPLVASGCSSTTTEPDAKGVTLHTHVPRSTQSPGGKTNATWAALQNADGTWAPLLPAASEPGTYAFLPPGDPWTVAFACANGEEALVVVQQAPASVHALDVELSSWCSPEGPDTLTINGTIRNIAPEVSWLDFGYALEERGAVIPHASNDAEYEQVNVTAGTWDLFFGLRTEPALPFTKIALLRDQTLSVDMRVDVDLTTAIAPATRPLALHGVDPAIDNVVFAPIRYTTKGGIHGIDVGPRDVSNTPDTVTTYSTLPEAVQMPSDRYRLEALAGVGTNDDAEGSLRGATATFHAPFDLDVRLVAPLAPPAVVVLPGASYRAEARTTARANVARYELDVVKRISNREKREWRVRVDAALITGPEVVLSTPDLANAPGFDASWLLPAMGRADVTVTARERPAPFGDGEITHWASYITVLRDN